jgi:hypothetical protein
VGTVAKSYLVVFFRLASFAAFFILVGGLALSPHRLSGTWSGSASRYLLIYLSVSFGLFWLIRWLLPNKQNLAFLLCAIVFLLFAAGLVQVLSVVFVMFSCSCLGLWVMGLLHFDTAPPQFITSTIFGAAINILLFSSLLLVPIHYQIVYFAIFALPIIFLLCSPTLTGLVFSAAQVQLARLTTELQLTGRKSFFIFILVFTYIASYVLFPNINSDENAVHLSIWTQFSTNAFFPLIRQVKFGLPRPIPWQ